MSINRSIPYKISVVIPIFSAFLIISAVVGIIGNAIPLENTDSFSPGNSEEDYIIRTVISAILTVFFILTTVFTAYEVASPMKYEPKVITDELNAMMYNFTRKAESWEVLLATSSIIILPIGVAKSLLSYDPSYFFMGMIALAIPMYTYNSRMKLRETIRQFIPVNPEIKLRDFSNLISKDPKHVKKAVLYLISYERFPAKYVFEKDLIIYLGERIPQQVPTSEKLASQPVHEFPEIPPTHNPECAYCGSKALVNDAKFCADCGASMVAVK
ncbi:MAG: hypothetical protein ACXAD7_22710 [Candidatus Kariarchaeaceae archaeon]|jgi:hypothetical protein